MKGWCKIIEVDGHDFLIERLVDKTNGEHVSIKFRVDAGQLIQLGRFKNVLDSKKAANDYFESVDEELLREKFMPAFKHILDENEPEPEEINSAEIYNEEDRSGEVREQRDGGES